MSTPPRPNFAAAIYHSGEWAAREIVRRHQIERGLRGCVTGGRSELPEDERGANDYDVRELDRVARKLAHPKLTPKERERLLDVRDAILARPSLRSDSKWSRAAAEETLALASGRGETPQALSSGALRIDGRNPLASLLDSGRLSHDQYDAGKAVRDMYDARFAGLGSQMEMLANTTGSSKDNRATVWAGIQRGKALVRLGNIERAVALNARDDKGDRDPNALAMLRAVCGRGHTLTSLGVGAAYERNAASLLRALDIAAEIVPRASDMRAA